MAAEWIEGSSLLGCKRGTTGGGRGLKKRSESEGEGSLMGRGGRRAVVFKPLGSQGREAAKWRLSGLPGRLVERAYRRILPKHLVKGSVSRTHRRPQGALNRQRQNLPIMARRLRTPAIQIRLNRKLMRPAARLQASWLNGCVQPQRVQESESKMSPHKACTKCSHNTGVSKGGNG